MKKSYSVKDIYNVKINNTYSPKQVSIIGTCQLFSNTRARGSDYNPGNVGINSNDILNTSTQQTATGCMNQCINNPNCRQFSYNSSDSTCTLYKYLYPYNGASDIGINSGWTSGICRNPWYSPNVIQFSNLQVPAGENNAGQPSCIRNQGPENTIVQIEPCDSNDPSQLWVLNQYGNFISLNTGYSLNVYGAPKTANPQSNIIVYPAAYQPLDSQFMLLNDPNGNPTIYNPLSGGCIAPVGGSATPATNLNITPCPTASGAGPFEIILPSTCPSLNTSS